MLVACDDDDELPTPLNNIGVPCAGDNVGEPFDDSFGNSGGTVCGPGIKIDGEFSIGAVSPFGSAADASFDVSRSNVVIPQSQQIDIVLLNSANNTVAQQTFSATNANGQITFDNPFAVDQFLLSNGASATAATVQLQPTLVTEVVGENRFIIEVRYNNVVMHSAGALWYIEPCVASSGGFGSGELGVC